MDEPRIGDHICYISDLTKMRTDYPGWDVTVSLDRILGEIVAAWEARAARRGGLGSAGAT